MHSSGTCDSKVIYYVNTEIHLHMKAKLIENDVNNSTYTRSMSDRSALKRLLVTLPTIDVLHSGTEAGI